MSAIQADPRYKDALLWHYTNSNDIARARMADMYGVKDQAYRAWPGAPAPVVNNYYPPTAPATDPATPTPATAQPATPAKGGWLKPLALAGLVGTIGGGGLAGGGWYLANQISNLPKTVPTMPAQSLDVKIGFDADKGGLQVGPAVPVPTAPVKK